MKRKIISVFCLLLMITMIITPVFAKGPSYETLDPGGDGGAGGGDWNGGAGGNRPAEWGNSSSFLDTIISTRK